MRERRTYASPMAWLRRPRMSGWNQTSCRQTMSAAMAERDVVMSSNRRMYSACVALSSAPSLFVPGGARASGRGVRVGGPDLDKTKSGSVEEVEGVDKDTALRKR